ncbi:MAG: hypothetical protein C4555_03170 [Dehalococcoidia bacterium]|nr:MAG: hypothetical protein C4555_03170 [Dehalococcoidia bacterium]
MSSNALANKDDNSEVVLENTISLKHFYPKLRKLGKYLLTNDRPETLKEACEKAGVKYGSTRELIRRSKAKGYDFYEFLNQVSDSFLHENLVAVDGALVEGAVSGSHNHQKLYYQRIGKLNEGPTLNVNHLTIGVNIGGILPQDSERSKGTIDVEPIIPKLK